MPQQISRSANWRYAGWTLLAILLLVILESFADSNYLPLGLHTHCVRTAYSILHIDPFLRNTPQETDLPASLKFTIDGHRAVFRKGSKSYNQVINLLANGRSQVEAVLSQPPGVNPIKGSDCGEITVSDWIATCYFPIIRDGVNPDFYWIWLPSLVNYHGARQFPFTADPRVMNLVKATGTD